MHRINEDTIGEVHFWEYQNGSGYCLEVNAGDSDYIYLWPCSAGDSEELFAPEPYSGVQALESLYDGHVMCATSVANDVYVNLRANENGAACLWTGTAPITPNDIYKARGAQGLCGLYKLSVSQINVFKAWWEWERINTLAM